MAERYTIKSAIDLKEELEKLEPVFPSETWTDIETSFADQGVFYGRKLRRIITKLKNLKSLLLARLVTKKPLLTRRGGKEKWWWELDSNHVA
ncbi:hypothetical protein [Ruficoccus sp. ZRK36]|uniref:hypothetical protein n=1 Tax=Ruficoccus sp. ZRK36 TaxID=2866311 RepID=UPI001C73415B|nr:hypothetical protein [Ruficoccus sp. ZRK36]QYY34907.1 hypothetical protein K0V07_11400 [Ruficoccus sp. ZRK36]